MKNFTTKAVFAAFTAKSIAAGQTDNVISLGFSDLTRQSERHFIKCIEADEALTWDGENTIISNGCTVTGFAFWASVQATQLDGFMHRHRILALVRPDGCRAYAIPVSKLEGTLKLPDIELTSSELDSYIRIANTLTPAPAEYTVPRPHPAKAAVKANRAEWRDNELNLEALGQLLKQHSDWLFHVITAALDVQLRSFAPCAEVPIFLYNFTAKKPNLQADQAITRAFTALNLTTAGATCNSAPPQITVLDSGDLADWSGCRDRLVLLRTSTGAPLKPLFDALDECERQTRFGGVLPRRLATVPIVRSRTIFDRSDTVDIELPSTIDSLTNYDLDLLRIAAARTLTKANAAEAYRRWYGPMTSLARYQLDPFEVWRDAVVRVFLEANLPSHGMAFTAAYDGLETAQASQLRAEEEREETLRRALELLGDQSRYEDEIIPKPATADEATRLLDEEREAVAFRHTPTRGPESGKHFIIFSNASLFRLLKRVNMDELLFDTFKKRASALAILVRQSYAVKFGTVPFNGFWIVDEKF